MLYTGSYNKVKDYNEYVLRSCGDNRYFTFVLSLVRKKRFELIRRIKKSRRGAIGLLSEVNYKL